jgi:hypothetical protein
MATQRPVHIDATSGNVRELVAGDKLGGITNGTATGEALTFDAIGVSVQAYDADLAAVAGLSSSGLIARTGAGAVAARTITGTTNQVTVTNGDGVSGNPTLSLPQSIDTAAAPVFAQLIVRADGGTGITASRYSTNTGGPNVTLQKAGGTIASPLDAAAGYVAFNLLAQAYQASAFRTIANLQARCASGFGTSGTDSPGVWAFQTTPDGSATQRDVVLFDDAGNVQFVVAGTLNAAAVDVVSMVGVDNGAGNRELQVQPESGGLLAYGADVLRRVPTANRNVDDRIKSVTTTDATVTTVDTIPITASSTYLIQTRIVGRRTGGVSGTADDGCSYVRRGTYTTKAGTVTLMGAVETIGTDREDQAGFDATLTISSTNVLVRVTGAASNNMSWQAHTLVERIAS